MFSILCAPGTHANFGFASHDLGSLASDFGKYIDMTHSGWKQKVKQTRGGAVILQGCEKLTRNNWLLAQIPCWWCWRTHASGFFSLFSKRVPACRNTARLLAGRFEKMKKTCRERVCNSTISMGGGGHNQSFFHC